MSNSPFKLLDFLGFLFPGAIVLIALYAFFPNLLEFLKLSTDTDTNAVQYVVYIIIAYLIGHLVSLLSSITIEKYSIWKYGYPSEFLLTDYTRGDYLTRESEMDNSKIEDEKEMGRYRSYKKIARIIIFIIILPVSIADVVFSKFGIDYYYTRKLSGFQISMIKGKCALLFRSLGLSYNLDNIFAGDNHRIVHNYYYENADMHKNRMDNCIAVYDFLRAMSFVACIVFLCLLGRSLTTINFHYQIDWKQIIEIVSIGAVAYLFYMGFLKYYRKFTLENFMCLLSDKEFNFPEYPQDYLNKISDENTNNEDTNNSDAESSDTIKFNKL